MRGRLPSMRGVEAFISAAETLSFRVTSERLNLTVSAVSYRIQALEHELGFPLFERRGPSIKLTTMGATFRDQLRPIFDNLLQTTDAIQSASDNQVVRIASFQFFHEHWLVPRLHDFLDRYPKAKVELVTLRKRTVGQPDLSIRIVRPGDIRREDELLFPWDLVPVCTPGLIEKFDIREPVDLLRARLIESSSATSLWSRWFAEAGIPADAPHEFLIAEAATLTIELAAAGLGVAMMAQFQTVYRDLRGLVEPFPIRCTFPGGVYVNRAAPHERSIVTAFRKWLNANAASTIGAPEDAPTFEDRAFAQHIDK